MLINGEHITVPTTISTVIELIDHLEIKNKIIIVEHNEHILKKEDHSQTKVVAGDKIEFVQFVGGG